MSLMATLLVDLGSKTYLILIILRSTYLSMEVDLILIFIFTYSMCTPSYQIMLSFIIIILIQFHYLIFIAIYYPTQLINHSQMSMKGRVAIVTASSTGIGKAIVTRLGQQGCKVVVSSRKRSNIDETVNELKSKGIDAIGIVCHVGKKQDRVNLIKQTIEKLGRIDFVVANAAVSTHMGDFFEATQQQIQKMWEVNFMATFFLIKEALPYLRKQPGSSVVIISSYTGYEMSQMIGHYALTKTALLGLTKALAAELLQEQIRVNGAVPGLIKTQFSGSLWKENQKLAKDVMGVKRLGETRDVANLVQFLLSNEASYITGENILVAGRPISRL